ncbi:flagellar assembly peptidoglycan hydrolase FlgJ [Methylobacter sp.]|uniref:flagellar assembly peptidoglycan hydrolase FlgJ n=1 Tax=Methylobacter sp. TaxID=2051955 RepID=UPI0012209D78|nr:flagellar assembly peptidoglycan hydrolase FlgJ [Methylobacter sp.]TAK64313.1 MAG: flagellar assembly peptidoglycan hydrolase FlgJ [Methylobacter sp.]
MLSGPQNADVYTDFNGLAKLKGQARKESPEALKEVAKQFESIFLNNVLKSMREAKLADGAMDNNQSKFYNDMYDQQLAVHLSGSPGVGLADLIVKQLSHDKSKNEKQDIEDYLNKSGGLSRSGSEQAHAVNRQVSGKSAGSTDDQAKITPYIQDGTPFNKMVEFPFNNDHNLPIQSAEEFVRRLHPLAVQAAKELGVEPKVILAQAALESGWGRSVIKNSNGGNSFNLFNIKADKAWQGKQAQVATLEFDQGIAKKVNAGFRSYDSFEESFKDYVDFIKSNPRYGDALKKAGNAEQYMRELQRAGYATDPQYANKVISIYQGNTMDEFEPDVIVAMNQ